MLKIATCQMTSGSDVQENLKKASSLIRQAALQGAELAILPEMFPLMGDTDALFKIAEDYESGPIQEEIANVAKQNGITVVAGSIPLKSDTPDRIYNSSIVYDSFGGTLARYDKIHLFAYSHATESHDETQYFKPGTKPVHFSLPLVNGVTLKVGLAVCYDLRFPRLFRYMDTPDLIVLPSAFTVNTGRAHWELLLRARAVENLCYVAAAGQAGTNDSGRSFWGHSTIVDPWGNVVSKLDQTQTGVSIATVNPTLIAQVRATLPALLNRTEYDLE